MKFFLFIPGLSMTFRQFPAILDLSLIIMVALRSRCGHYVFALWFLSIFFLFPRLISVAAQWMSTILRHMMWP